MIGNIIFIFLSVLCHSRVNKNLLDESLVMISRNTILLIMFGVSGFLPPFIARSIDLALPALAQEFGMNVIAMSWVITAYLLTTASLIIPCGRCADIVGRRTIFIIGVSLFTGTTVLCVCATSGVFLIGARIVQGAASAMIFGTANALLLALFEPRRRAHAFAINVSGIYAGSFLGPSLGGMMTQYFGWRSLFVLTTVLGLIVVAIALRYLDQEEPEAREETFDYCGAFLYVAAMVSCLYGITRLSSWFGFCMLMAGCLLSGLFWFFQRHKHHSVFDPRILINNPIFGLLSLAALFNFMASFAVTFLLSLFLQFIKGMTPTSAGLVLLVAPLTIFIGSPLAGKLSNRYDPRVIALWGMSCSTAALLILAWSINQQTSPLHVMVLLFMFGVGTGMFASPNTNAAMSSVARKHAGVAASVINSMRLFGQAMSMGLATLILSCHVPQERMCCGGTLPQLMAGIHTALLILACMGLVSVILSRASCKRIQLERHIP